MRPRSRTRIYLLIHHSYRTSDLLPCVFALPHSQVLLFSSQLDQNKAVSVPGQHADMRWESTVQLMRDGTDGAEMLDLFQALSFGYKASSSLWKYMGTKINGSLRVWRSVFETCSRWWVLDFSKCLVGRCGKERKQMLLAPSGNI